MRRARLKEINQHKYIYTSTWGTAQPWEEIPPMEKATPKGQNSQLPQQKQVELFAVMRLETTPSTASFILPSHDI